MTSITCSADKKIYAVKKKRKKERLERYHWLTSRGNWRSSLGWFCYWYSQRAFNVCGSKLILFTLRSLSRRSRIYHFSVFKHKLIEVKTGNIINCPLDWRPKGAPIQHRLFLVKFNNYLLSVYSTLNQDSPGMGRYLDSWPARVDARHLRADKCEAGTKEGIFAKWSVTP